MHHTAQEKRALQTNWHSKMFVQQTVGLLRFSRCVFVFSTVRETVCRRTCCAVRHLVADLSVVTDFARRNLPDSLFQLCHQHFIEHQECLPEEQEKIMIK